MSAVHDGRCSPWVMCSCSVVSGNQIHDSLTHKNLKDSPETFLCLLFLFQIQI